MAKKKIKSVLATVIDTNHNTVADHVEIFQVEKSKDRKKKFKPETVIRVAKEVQLKQGNLISVGNSFKQRTALVKSVQEGDTDNLVTILHCGGIIQVWRVGYYRYNFLKESTEDKIAMLPVCLSNAARTVLKDYAYDWNLKRYVGKALFITPKIDVRQFDGILFSWYVFSQQAYIQKELLYMVDEIDDKSYEGLLAVAASADSGELPRVHVSWHNHSKNV